MKRIKGIIVLLILLVATPVFADYTVDIKNESGDVIKTYIVTTAQVEHLQKVAGRPGGKSVLNQFKEAILDLISNAERTNEAIYNAENSAAHKALSRQ